MNVINARLRPELIITPHHTNRGRYWVVEDPIALKYFRLRDEECFVLTSLASKLSLEDLRRKFNDHFHPLKLGLRQLNQFLFHLHELGLIVGDVPGQGTVLSKRHRSNMRKRMVSSFANPLAIRIPGIAATKIIDILYPTARLLLSRPAIVFWILLTLSALSLMVVEFTAFQSRLPSFSEFFSPKTALGFAIALIFTKALHEFGHAIVSRHLGGGCREIGVIFLALIPTLYCDVSDAWRISNRWHRILVSMAGVFAELVLASFVTFIWWFSEPGELQTFALHILFLCSVSTLLFNVNPLVRCDGYYVLSDLTDTPNLWQESRAMWRRAMSSWLRGQPIECPQNIPRSHILPLMFYSACSTIYCIALIVGILWMAFRILEPHGLMSLAWILSIVVVGGFVAPSVLAMGRFASSPGRRSGFRASRTVGSIFTTSVLVGILFLLPLPSRLNAPFVIEPLNAHSIYAPVAGTIKFAVNDQAIVLKGDRLVELHSDEIELKIAEAEADVDQHRQRLANLRKMHLVDPTVAPLIPAEEQTLLDSLTRLELSREDRSRLVLRSPIDAVVYAPPEVVHESKSQLTSWSGTPLQAKNLDANIRIGQLVCLVGKPGQFRASVFIAQSDVSRITPTQAVTLRIDQLPSHLFQGTIVDVAKKDTSEIPSGLALQLGLQTSNERQEGETYYQATVHFDLRGMSIVQGMTGRAKISTGRRTLANRLADFFRSNFTLP